LSFLGFTTLQLVFAMVAHSESMLTDCAAMYVDVLSYLVNFMAERLKHGKQTVSAESSPHALRLRRLYLELVPPLVSVTTLVGVTIVSLQQATEVLFNREKYATATEPDLQLMLLFSGLNLLLDFINVTCFARVDQAIGLPGQKGEENVHVHFEKSTTTPLPATEETSLLGKHEKHNDTDNDSHSCADEEHQGMNLNMCSAWTHICADTLRSIAVLIAAGFASLFPSLLSPMAADSWGSVVVSVIILVSLIPLIQGLFLTAVKIQAIWKDNGEHSSSHVLDV
jgi:Co/Zn/Cd efflux system component